MLTYQDLQNVGEYEKNRMDFVYRSINAHKSSQLYKDAVIADTYDRHKNKTINEYRKLLYTITGKAVPDNWSANYKMASRFFNRFVVQENQYLLGNGIVWENEDTRQVLGQDFDIRLQEAGKMALVGGVSFGFFNLDHLEVFSVMEFAPLYDEDNGALMAGIRFWQVAGDKPLRATLYEIDGVTEYIWKDGVGEVLQEKRPYVFKIESTAVDGAQIYDGENYESFPIVPLWGNPHRQSELIGIREQIDAYDLIKSGFCNTVDEASMVYWVINNAGGMDDIDLAKFVERIKTVHAATVEDDGARAEAHSLEAPYASREALLTRLEKDLYKDAMALDTENIASGVTTATQIKASYEPLNSKVDQYEYCIKEFLQDILNIAGLEDNPTFTRSMLVNANEEVQTVLSAAEYLEPTYVTEKILNLLGDGDKASDILKQIDADELDRVNVPQGGENPIRTENNGSEA